MGSSSASHSKRNAVYGLPTFWGAVMFALVGCALWFSIFSQSPVDRWIAFVMIILILLHLAESNNPFRSLEFTFLPFEPPFAFEPSEISIEVSNPTDIASEPLYFRLRGQKNWAMLSEIPAKSHRRVMISLPALPRGSNRLPSLTVRTRPTTQLFQLWNVLKTHLDFFVLPAAKDHSVDFLRRLPQGDESELSHIEAINDPRLMYKMDHKLFLKTGKPYYRKSESKQSEPSIHLDWDALKHLGPIEREEQFSSWLKQLSDKTAGSRSALSIEVSAPFAQLAMSSQSASWHALKEKYAEWLSANDVGSAK